MSVSEWPPRSWDSKLQKEVAQKRVQNTVNVVAIMVKCNKYIIKIQWYTKDPRAKWKSQKITPWLKMKQANAKCWNIVTRQKMTIPYNEEQE